MLFGFIVKGAEYNFKGIVGAIGEDDARLIIKSHHDVDMDDIDIVSPDELVNIDFKGLAYLGEGVD